MGVPLDVLSLSMRREGVAQNKNIRNHEVGPSAAPSSVCLTPGLRINQADALTLQFMSS